MYNISIGIYKQITAYVILKKEDYHGQYIICRDRYPGAQADWQYNHYRFEITDKDSLLFYETENEKIIKTYRGTISTITPYKSARLMIQMDSGRNHILTENPTTYRNSWNFYLVFHSPIFGNVFFKKGKWKPLKK